MLINKLEVFDESLFRDFVKSHRENGNCDMKDSWAYVLQATRHNPFKLMFENSLFCFGYKSDNSALVVPNYFALDNMSLVEGISYLRRSFNLPVILKNVDLKDISGLIREGFKVYEEHQLWSLNSKYDDQTFPQRVCSIGYLLALQGHSYAYLRRRLRYCDEIEGREYSENDFLEIHDLLQRQDNRMNGQAYNSQRLFLDLSNTENTYKFTFFKEGKVIAFTLADRISQECFALNGIIYDSSIRGGSSRAIYETAKCLSVVGCKYINLQGSENGSLDYWKKFFNPQISIEKTHLIWV